MTFVCVPEEAVGSGRVLPQINSETAGRTARASERRTGRVPVIVAHFPVARGFHPSFRHPDDAGGLAAGGDGLIARQDSLSHPHRHDDIRMAGNAVRAETLTFVGERGLMRPIRRPWRRAPRSGADSPP